MKNTKAAIPKLLQLMKKGNVITHNKGIAIFTDMHTDLYDNETIETITAEVNYTLFSGFSLSLHSELSDSDITIQKNMKRAHDALFMHGKIFYILSDK